MTGKAVWSEGGRGTEGRLVRVGVGRDREAVWSEEGRDREDRLVRGREGQGGRLVRGRERQGGPSG